MVAKLAYSPTLLKDLENIDIWLREIELWQWVTELSIKQSGPAIYVSLPSKICQACIDISVRSLSSDNGFATSLEKIKGLDAEDKYSLAYMVYIWNIPSSKWNEYYWLHKWIRKVVQLNKAIWNGITNWCVSLMGLEKCYFKWKTETSPSHANISNIRQ